MHSGRIQGDAHRDLHRDHATSGAGRVDHGGGSHANAPYRVGHDDWRGYREQHRALFHVGRYVAPRGYGFGYRPFGRGYLLPRFFYARNYWIADPYAYRLPYAGWPYRWVRYYDDALLIDVRTGRVADAIRGFFW